MIQLILYFDIIIYNVTGSISKLTRGTILYMRCMNRLVS